MWALGSAEARAQAEPALGQTSTSAYDAYIEQALQAYDAGRFAEARASFRRAHEVNPTARTLRTIGMCSFNLGDYVDAATSLEAALEETRKPLTAEQRKQAAELIARSNQEIGRFQLRLSPADATLSLDGRPVTLNTQHELLVEPGRHELSIQARGHRSQRSGLSVEGGDRTTIEFNLVAVAEGADELPAPGSLQPTAAERPDSQLAGSPALTAPSQASHGLQRTLGYTSLGVGAAGLAVFGVFGVLAIVEQNKLQDACPNSACGPSHYQELDRYNTYKTVSTVGLISGGAFGLLGAGLLLFQPERLDHQRAALEPLLGIGSLGLRGSL
jgi:tetratricopeptide (TPR) repeat protein